MTVKAKNKSDGLLQNIHLLYRSLTDPKVPWYVKFLVGFIIAYIISPIDLIPDFIPVLGLLDEMILVPIGIGLALRLVPVEVMEKYQQVDDKGFSKSLVITGIVLVLSLWIALIFIISSNL